MTDRKRDVRAPVAAPTPKRNEVVNTPAAPRIDPLDAFFYRDDEEGPELGVDAPLLSQTSGTDEEEATEYLACSLAGEEYGIPLLAIREVQKPPSVTEVPRASTHVLGVITLRGEVLPLFDPKRRLRLPQTPLGLRSRVIIVDIGDGPCGLLVDGVGHVVRLAPSQIEATPVGLGGADGDVLEGVGRTDENRMLILLNLPAVLRVESPAAGSSRERS